MVCGQDTGLRSRGVGVLALKVSELVGQGGDPELPNRRAHRFLCSCGRLILCIAGKATGATPFATDGTAIAAAAVEAGMADIGDNCDLALAELVVDAAGLDESPEQVRGPQQQ